MNCSQMLGRSNQQFSLAAVMLGTTCIAVAFAVLPRPFVAYYLLLTLFFVPQLKWWKIIRTYAVPFKSPLRACGECGLVWTDIDNDLLRSLISQAGKVETKKQLGL